MGASERVGEVLNAEVDQIRPTSTPNAEVSIVRHIADVSVHMAFQGGLKACGVVGVDFNQEARAALAEQRGSVRMVPLRQLVEWQLREVYART